MNILSRKATLSLAVSVAVLSFVSGSSAAVLITTGKDPSGRAFIEFSEPITFEITTTIAVVDFGTIIKNAFPVAPSQHYDSNAGGLFGSMPGNPTAVFDYWTYGVSFTDVAIAALDGSSSKFNFVAGQTFTISPGRLTTSSPVSGTFPIFATGYYEMYLQNAFQPGEILSANAQAVPEPSAVALLALGGAAAFILRRKLA